MVPELVPTEKVLGGLHADCDWLLKSYGAQLRPGLVRLKAQAPPRMSSTVPIILEHVSINNVSLAGAVCGHAVKISNVL